MDIDVLPQIFIIILISLMVSTFTIDQPDIFINAISGDDIEPMKCVFQEIDNSIHCYEFSEDNDDTFLFSITPFPDDVLKFYFSFAAGGEKLVDLTKYIDVKNLEGVVDCRKISCTLELKDESSIDFLRLGDVLYLKWDTFENVLFSVHN